MGGWVVSACGGHRGGLTVSLGGHCHCMRSPFLSCGSFWVFRLSMGPLGSHPVFIPMSAFSVNLSSFWGGRVGNEHLENRKAGFCLFYRPGKAERSWGSCYLGLNCHICIRLRASCNKPWYKQTWFLDAQTHIPTEFSDEVGVTWHIQNFLL